MTLPLSLVFFCSGIAGLVYQVVWVREFGHAFGNTVQSASIVIALFMLGLGLGGYLVGRWADRRYQTAPESLLRVYAWIEVAIAGLGLGVSLVLPHLGALVATVSSYTTTSEGWFTLTLGSWLARGAIALLLLMPITLLMGGTLTLLIRFVVRADTSVSGWHVALLYGVNTAGAAMGAFLTDFALVPAAGLSGAQLTAVGLNILAGGGAWMLARQRQRQPHTAPGPANRKHSRPAPAGHRPGRRRKGTHVIEPAPAVPWTAAALALSGFAVMGIEILWLRHFTLLLGGFRAVFSLLMAVMLLALGIGALVGGWLDRRVGRPADTFMVVQALFVVTVLVGLGSADIASIATSGDSLAGSLREMGPARRALAETWYNLRPMLLEIALPALLAGCAFPLANAVAQRAEDAVGRRAGALYLANTAGAVCGSIATGYLLLPALGMQTAGTVLAAVAALVLVPLYMVSRQRVPFTMAAAAAAVALAAWLTLPADYLLTRALVPQQPGERVVTLSEGTTELIAVVERPGGGRGLITNGHAMSSTALLDQRYMRAMAHIPLLSMPSPQRALVIGFGVGNTTHAVSLHPSIQRVEVADLSRHVLEQAVYFREVNQGILESPRVSVYLNDGRQQLLMADEATYDLITLEPPPIAHAGVASLYSQEFYELARTRLKPGGYISQWLPAYQVPAEASLAMVRAFIDVFPQSVLLSGTQAELLLVGTTAPTIEIDPAALEARLAAAPAVRADLERLDLGTPLEIVGTFVGSAQTLADATRRSPAATDDRPLQEYGIRSTVGTVVTGVPAALFDLNAAADWCPRCFNAEGVAPEVAGLDLYLALLDQAYATPPAARIGPPEPVLGSAYLGAVLTDTPEVREILAAAHLRAGSELLAARHLTDAETELRQALQYMPQSAEAHNDLGVTLASLGRVSEAAEHFQRAVALQPDFAEARENLARARR